MIAWMGKRLLQSGYTAPSYPRHRHPRVSRGGGLQAADRAGGAARPAHHDLPRLDRRGRRGDPPGARRGAQGVRRNLPPIPVSDRAGPRPARPRGREVDVLPAAARSRRPGGALAGAGARRSADRLVRSRALSLRRDGQALAGPNPTFKEIANGMPGLELRLPLLFDAMVSNGRLGLEKFVELTATAPAKSTAWTEEGLDRDRRRRRHRDLGPARGSAQRRLCTTAPATRLMPAVRCRLAGHGDARGRGDRRRRQASGDAGSGRFLPRTGGGRPGRRAADAERWIRRATSAPSCCDPSVATCSD